ncbi:glutamate ligase domain-containing protein [Blattabacterium cuenoti]|uniref:glutamate ligase domain-containing protein n=1 Tax=Blattabacterium cuenoti TaxID=1653831 RepID=UPI001EEB36CD|nr:cyanophycin synthetase [Blattabacterium cuenoti]
MIKNNVKIIIDCYNANPTSMKKALTFFNNIQGKKIVILGDMLELGLFSNNEHEKIISFIKKSNIDIAFLIGNIFFNTKKTSNKIRKFTNKKNFVDWIKKFSIKKTDYILIKGSRKIALESLIHLI